MRNWLGKILSIGTIALLAFVGVPLTQAAPSETVTLDFPSWMWSEPGVGDYFNEAIAEFERENPNIKIRKTIIPAGEWEDKMIITLASGQAPDVLKLFTNNVPFFLDRGLLEPLNKWLDNAPFRNKLIGVQRVAVRDGKVYGVVLTASPHALQYNKKLFEAAGVTRAPTTPAELFEAARAIKAKTGRFGYAFASDPADVLQAYISLMQWVIGNGADFSKDGKPNCNDPRIVESLEWLKRMLDAEVAPRGAVVSTSRRMFWEGQLGMLIDGPYVMTYIRDRNPQLYPSIGYSPVPFALRDAGSITGGAFYTIPRVAKHKEEAWKWIEFINRDKWQRKWLEEQVQIPGTVVKPTEKFLKDNPWVNTMNDIAAKQKAGFGYAPPGFEKYGPEFRRIVIDHWAQVLAGRQAVKPAMDACQGALERWVATLPK
jgi:ABC-type glycerol-3-phosphate transport system substrate-binding protein